MKRITVLLCSVLFCTLAMAQNCTINGKIDKKEFDGKKVYLYNMSTQQKVDSTTITGGAFSFKTEVLKPVIFYIYTEQLGRNNYYYSKLLGEDGTIDVNMVSNELKGTPLNDLYAGFLGEKKKIESDYMALAEKMQNLQGSKDAEKQIAELSKDMEVVYNNYIVRLRESYLKNQENIVGALLLEELMSTDETLNLESAHALLDGACSDVLEYSPIQKKIAQLEIRDKTAVGKKFLDLDLKDGKTGKDVKLSSVINGKIALIDFWASWCRPCRAEIPNIANIYNKYGKDIVVISLNVWDKNDARVKAIKDLKMNWVQLTDETSNATDTYGIEGIPHIMLIGKDGIILNRDLRGEDIEKAVKEALGK